MAIWFSRSDTFKLFSFIYLKSRIYKTQPINLNDLQNMISTEINSWKKLELDQDIDSGDKIYAQRCLENGGKVMLKDLYVSIVFDLDHLQIFMLIEE